MPETEIVLRGMSDADAEEVASILTDGGVRQEVITREVVTHESVGSQGERDPASATPS